jgi:tetratricopeptide (TPR) repeat protein
MEARSLPEALTMIMKQRSCSQSQLGRDTGKGRTWVREMINGERGLDFAKVVDALARVGWEVVIRPKTESSGPVKRREFHNKILNVAGGAIAGKVAEVTFVPSAKTTPFQNPEYLTALADHLVHLRNEFGAARLISTARDYMARVNTAEVVSGGDRSLQMAAAKLARAQAFTFYDADRLGAAENAARRALAFAQASRHGETQALMYIARSQIATAAGAGDRSLHYVHQGWKIPGINDGYRAELLKRKMRALAILPGQEKAALAAYADIRNLDEGTFTFFNAVGPGLSANLGVALSDLGRHRAAMNAFADAASHYARSSPHFYAQNLADETAAALRSGMPDAAAEKMVTLAHVLPLVNSVQLHKDVNGILAAAAPWATVPDVRDACAQLREAVSPPGSREQGG